MLELGDAYLQSGFDQCSEPSTMEVMWFPHLVKSRLQASYFNP